MSWFKNKQNTSCLRNLCSNVLKAGEIPRHVAIIMDGNRRFAKKVNCERSEGHEKGFEKLTEVGKICLISLIFTLRVAMIMIATRIYVEIGP